MRANRIAVATLAAVTAFIVGGMVGSGQQSQGGSPTAPLAAPLPLGYSGEAIYPAFEGWGPTPDGQIVIRLGYFNRNKDQTIDIPIGPNNRIEPGGPDMLQPTHFEPGRGWGLFTLPVPKDSASKKYTWTLVANGKPAVVQFWANPPYWVDFYKHAARGNTPPVIKFSEQGPELTGPPSGIALNLTATVNQPLTLKLWAKDRGNTYDPEEGLPPELRSRGRGRGRGTADAATPGAPDAAPSAASADSPTAAGADANTPPPAGRGAAAARGRGGRAAAAARGRGAAPAGATPGQNWDVSAAAPRTAAGDGGLAAILAARGQGAGNEPDITVRWKVYRGSTPVKFADPSIRLFTGGDPNKVMEATTTATFSAPGDYMLRAQVNDDSGDGGAGEQCCWTNALVKVVVK